jgi:cytochrome c-type biogenesis protein
VDEMTDITYAGAFIAGFASFLSPCVLPLFPSYISFITGLSLEELRKGDSAQVRRRTMINSLLFIFGFSTVFVSMGASSSYIGAMLSTHREIIRIVGGIIIIIFGLYVMGVIKIHFLSREIKLHPIKRPAGYFGTFLIGMTFAAGWTPCIGPILGTILLMAASSNTVMYGVTLLLVYSAGLGIPFFVTSLAINSFLTYVRKIYQYMRFIMIISGLLLIVFGILLLTDYLVIVTGFFPNLEIL